MKKNDITTLDDLKVFLAAYQDENPEDDCCELVRNICQENGWIYTDDSSIGYDDEDFATDGDHILSLTSSGFEVFTNEGQDINYNDTYITVREELLCRFQHRSWRRYLPEGRLDAGEGYQ